jgi:chemotaxis protein CheY-P-specific phosphatase CheC
MDKTIAKSLDEDIIKEVGNILTHNSATAFSRFVKDSIMINTKIDLISVSDFKMEFIFKDDFAEVFSGLIENIFEGFFLKTSNGAEGISAIFFHRKQVDKLISSVASIYNKELEQSDEAKSEILKEFSNIIMQAYLTALGKLINEQIDSTMPIPAKDILGSLFEFKEILMSKKDDRALMIRTNISAKNTGIKGKLIILLRPDTIKTILEVLKKQAGEKS